MAIECKDIPSEMQLLCSSACPHIDTLSQPLRWSAFQEIRELAQPTIDWPRLIELAVAHGVLPLLYKNLTLAAPQRIESPLNRIKQLCKLNTIRNLKLAQELKFVLQLLAENSILAVSFKGPSLAVLAYGNISLRQFSDLDILIREQDFLAARRCLLSNQYLPIRSSGEREDVFDSRRDLAQIKTLGECSFQRRDSAVSLDVHCRLVTGKFPISTADLNVFWSDIQPLAVLDSQVETFCPEDLLLYLCIHGAKDFWRKLIWLCDVAALVESHPQLDWQKVVEQARRLECEPMLWLGLLLAEEILGVVLPGAIAQNIEDSFTKKPLLARIQKRLLKGEMPQEVKHFYLERFYFYGQMQRTPGMQLSYYLRYAPVFIKAWLFNRIKKEI